MIKAKKHLGQHFLKDESISRDIVAALSKKGYSTVLEIGPGTGALTSHLFKNGDIDLFLVEVDRDSVDYLKNKFPSLQDKIFSEDFLKMNLKDIFGDRHVAIIGNFPYNISSQILFRIFEQRSQVPEAVGMFQKEVAERISSPPGSRNYGILSVLMQAFYNVEYLFTVNEDVFVPPPKVKSAVIRLIRNNTVRLGCNEDLFLKVVKTAFNQRRKTLRNAVKSMIAGKTISEIENNSMLKQRAEQLSVGDFVALTRWIETKSCMENE